MNERRGHGTRSSPALLLVAAAAIACYSNSLRCELVYDDRNAIADNLAVRRLDVRAIFTTASWFGKPVPVYRPITTLGFALERAVHGVSPLGYHLVNVALHAAVSILAALVVRRVTGDPPLAIASALLFATHPAHTEAVTSVVGRAEEQAALFGLAAWLVLRDGRSATRIALSALLFLLSALSKESGLTFLGAIVVAALLDARGRRPSWTAWTALVATAVFAVAMRTLALGTATPPVTRLDNVAATAPLAPRLLTAVGVLARYMRVLAWPVHLSADYSYPQIPLVVSPADPLFLAGLLLLVAAAAGVVWGWRHDRNVAFAIAFSAVTLSLTSNVVVPIGTIMAERLLYVPSLGFCLLVAIAIRRLAPRGGGRVAPVVLCGMLALAYGVRTAARNPVWRDPRTFAEALVRDAPDSARSHRELGLVYAQAGEHDRARAELRTALALDPRDPITLYDLGNVELGARRLDEAIAAYRGALAEEPDDVDTIINLGNAYSTRGDEAEAATWFRRALAIAPDALGARVNLANALLRVGRPDEAEDHYRRAVALAPDDAGIRFNHGVCLEHLGRFSDAVDEYRIARTYAPDSAPVAVRLVAALAAAGRIDEARAEQARAEARFPRDPGVLAMRAVLGAVAP